MTFRVAIRGGGAALAVVVAASVSGCQSMTQTAALGQPKVVAAPTAHEKECLTRGMYFESNRSDDDGLLAVGTVIMNRLKSPDYPASICGIVGAPRQFAQGVLTKPMADSEKVRVQHVATALLAGKRHAGVKNALHFHIAGRTYGYPNMRYVALTGGNRFYEKTDRAGNRPVTLPEAVCKKDGGLVPLKVAFAALAPEAE